MALRESFFPRALFFPKQTIYCVNTSSDNTYGTPGLSVEWLVMLSRSEWFTNNRQQKELFIIKAATVDLFLPPLPTCTLL